LFEKIIILRSDLLLNAGILNFLNAQGGFDVTGLESDDPEQIFQEIERIQPGVIISDQTNLLPSFISLLLHYVDIPQTRMILLNESDNQLQICDIKQVEIQQLSDFIALLNVSEGKHEV